MQIGDLTLSYGQNYTFVPSNGTPAENAEALRATYNTSRVKRPQGKALSRDNRFANISMGRKILISALGITITDELTTTA